MSTRDQSSSDAPWSSKLLDKLPVWAQIILGILGVVGFVYCAKADGLGTTILHVIFGP